MLTIKVLGSGCANCKKLEAVTRQVVQKMNVTAEVVKVTEYPEIMKYNVMATPGLVINEKVVSAGRIPSEQLIQTWIEAALAKV